MARPRKEVDENLIIDLASIGCTVAEIATVAHVDKRTLERRYKLAIERGREQGKESLRRMQWKKAQEGDKTLLIWLGKQLLGQKDRQQISADPDAPPRIIVEYVDTPPRRA